MFYSKSSGKQHKLCLNDLLKILNCPYLDMGGEVVEVIVAASGVCIFRSPDIDSAAMLISTTAPTAFEAGLSITQSETANSL